MKEFFIQANSFAAPFFSDSSSSFEHAETAEDALNNFAKKYTHPCGLFSALAYESADAYHKGAKPVGKWLCNHEIEKERLTKDKGAYSYLGHAPGDFEIDHVRVTVENPKHGRVVSI